MLLSLKFAHFLRACCTVCELKTDSPGCHTRQTAGVEPNTTARQAWGGRTAVFPSEVLPSVQKQCESTTWGTAILLWGNKFIYETNSTISLNPSLLLKIYSEEIILASTLTSGMGYSRLLALPGLDSPSPSAQRWLCGGKAHHGL